MNDTPGSKPFLFDNSPGLRPWYIGKHEPALLLQDKLLSWEYVDTIKDRVYDTFDEYNEAYKETYIGVYTLCKEDIVLGLFNSHVYVQPNAAGDYFCVWPRYGRTVLGVTSLEINLYRTSDLQPFPEPIEAIRKFAAKGAYAFNCQPVATVSLKLVRNSEIIEIAFPEAFHLFDELIAITKIPDLYPGGNFYWDTTVLGTIQPKQNRVLVYPQNWFNKDEEIDRVCQWISRAVRSPVNHHIYVQGMRINSFELDETNRQRK